MRHGMAFLLSCQWGVCERHQHVSRRTVIPSINRGKQLSIFLHQVSQFCHHLAPLSGWKELP